MALRDISPLAGRFSRIIDMIHRSPIFRWYRFKRHGRTQTHLDDRLLKDVGLIRMRFRAGGFVTEGIFLA